MTSNLALYTNGPFRVFDAFYIGRYKIDAMIYTAPELQMLSWIIGIA